MSESGDYESFLRNMHDADEARCRRCGACCGAHEPDPCSRLAGSPGGYSCSVYDRRLGPQKTVSGKEFLCVPIRKILFESWSGSWRCAYKRAR